MLIKTRLLPPQQKPGLGSEIDWGHPLSRGLVGCWLFNEGAGRLAMDIAGQNHGLMSNFAGTPSSGWSGGALAFDGSDDYIRVPGHPRLTVGSGDFSLVTSIRCDAAPATTDAGVLNPDDASAASHGYYLWISSALSLHYIVRGASSLINRSLNVLTLGKLVQVALSYRANNSIGCSLFVGSSLIESRDSTVVGAITNTLGLIFGRRAVASINTLSGIMRHAMIYARALTPDEVRWLAAEPYAMVLPAGPRRRWFLPLAQSLTDSVTVGVTEAAAGAGAAALADNLTVGISEAAAGAGSASLSDALTVGVTDTLTDAQAAIARTDALTVGLSESAAGETGDEGAYLVTELPDRFIVEEIEDKFLVTELPDRFLVTELP